MMVYINPDLTLVLFRSPPREVKLETGKDKELFYRKTRLAWAA